MNAMVLEGIVNELETYRLGEKRWLIDVEGELLAVLFEVIPERLEGLAETFPV